MSINNSFNDRFQDYNTSNPKTNNNVTLTGNQTVSGQKTYVDSIFFGDDIDDNVTIKGSLSVGNNLIIPDNKILSKHISSLADTKLSVNIPKKNEVNIFNETNTIQDLIVVDTVTFSNNSISDNALTANIVKKDAVNVYTNSQQFDNDVTFGDNVTFIPGTIGNNALHDSVAIKAGGLQIWNNTQQFNQNTTFEETSTFNNITATGTLNFPNDSIDDLNLSTNIAKKDSVNSFSSQQTFNARAVFNDDVSFQANSISNGALQANVAMLTGTTDNNNTQTFTIDNTIFLRAVEFNDPVQFTDNVSIDNDVTITGAINLENNSINDDYLTSNIPKKDVNNTFTGNQSFNNLTISNNLNIPDNSIAVSKVDADLVLTTDANQFSKKQFFIKEDDETETLGVTEIYAGQLKVEALNWDGLGGSIVTHFDTHYKNEADLYGCYMLNLTVSSILQANLLYVGNTITAAKIQVSELEFGSKMKVKSLQDSGLGRIEQVGGGINMGDENNDRLDSGNLENVNEIDADKITFITDINGVTAATFAYIDATSSIQTQINTKSTIAGPVFSGIPRCPTASNAINTTQIASTAYVKNVIGDLINGAGSTLDTLNELSAALGDDADFSTTMTNLIGTKVAQNTYDTQYNNQNNLISTNASDIEGLEDSISNIDNTSDNDKPVSAAVTSQLNLKANASEITNIDNTSDNDKPVSAAVTSQLNLKANASEITNIDNTSDDDKPVSAAVTTALGLKLNNSGGTLTGEFTSTETMSMYEKLSSSIVNSNTTNINFNHSGVHHINLTDGNNFEALALNCNPSSNTNTCCIFTMIIDCSTYEAFASTCKVNNTSRAIKFAGGIDNIDISGSSFIQQSVAIIYKDSATVPITVMSTVTPYF